MPSRSSGSPPRRPGIGWISDTQFEKHKSAKRKDPQALDADLARQLRDRPEQLRD